MTYKFGKYDHNVNENMQKRQEERNILLQEFLQRQQERQRQEERNILIQEVENLIQNNQIDLEYVNYEMQQHPSTDILQQLQNQREMLLIEQRYLLNILVLPFEF